MIVEELTLQVDAPDIEGFLEADARVWTAFLAAQPGFVRKEVWVPGDRPNTVVILVWWASSRAVEGDQRRDRGGRGPGDGEVVPRADRARVRRRWVSSPT